MIANLNRKYEADYYFRSYAYRIRSRQNRLQIFRKVVQDHPQWKASLFDEHFFKVKVLPMVEEARKNGSQVNTSQITSAWADQLRLDEASREHRMKELAPLADQLLTDLG